MTIRRLLDILFGYRPPHPLPVEFISMQEDHLKAIAKAKNAVSNLGADRAVVELRELEAVARRR